MGESSGQSSSARSRMDRVASGRGLGSLREHAIERKEGRKEEVV